MSDVRVDVASPQHGWLPITIRVDDEAVECQASHIVDTLKDLVYAALELTERRAPRPIIIFEEPGAIRVSLVGSEQLVALTITRHRDLASAQNDQNGASMLSSSVERIGLARAIWSGMRRLERTVSREQIEAAWHNAFPAKEIAQLGERLSGDA